MGGKKYSMNADVNYIFFPPEILLINNIASNIADYSAILLNNQQ